MTDSSRRTLLQALAAAGVAGAGVAGMAGSAGAQDDQDEQDEQEFRGLSFTVDESGVVVEETDAVTEFEVDDEVQFAGSIEFTDLYVDVEDRLIASGWLFGELSNGETETVDEEYEDLVLGPLEEVFGLEGTLVDPEEDEMDPDDEDDAEADEDDDVEDDADQDDEDAEGDVEEDETDAEADEEDDEVDPDEPLEAQECPLLDLDVDGAFVDLIGVELEESVISIDVVAIAGEDNVLGALLCAVAHLADDDEGEEDEMDAETDDEEDGTDDAEGGPDDADDDGADENDD